MRIKKQPEFQEKLEKLEQQIERIKEKRKENLENPYKIIMYLILLVYHYF